MKKRLFYGIIACTLLAGACSDDAADPSGAAPDAPLVLAGEVRTFDPEAGAAVWGVGRSVGLFLVDSDTKEVIDPYRNVKYVSTKRPEGYFSPEEPDQVVRLTAQRADAVLYYPYREDAATLFPLEIASQPASLADLRYGRGEGVSCTDNRRKLTLRPLFSQLVFEVVAGEGVTDEYLQGAAIVVEGVCSQADFNLATGAFENGRDIRPITLAPAATGRGASGLLFPQATVGDAVRAVITLPRMNRTEEWPFNERIPALEPGMRYICTVRVSQQRIDVTTQAEPIEEWTDGSASSGSGRRTEILPATRTATEGRKSVFVEDDRIGILQVVRNADELLATNLPHTFTGGQWSSDAALAFPVDGRAVDFHAYYPYTPQAAGLSFEHTVAADQSEAGAFEASDLLQASCTDASGTEQVISLRFSHTLALAEVTVDGLPADDPAATVTIRACRSVRVDLRTGTATSDPEAATEPVTMRRLPDGTFRAVIPAQQISAGSPIRITTQSGKTYRYRRDTPTEFSAGRIAVFAIDCSE